MNRFIPTFIVTTLIFLTPFFVGAQIGDNNSGTIGDNPGSSMGVKLANPLGNQTIMGFLNDLLGAIMVFAVPLIVFMIIYAGFLFVVDRGSQKTLAQAKRALLYAVIGGVLILGAQALLIIIQGTVDSFR